MGVELYKHNKVAYEKVEKMFEKENRVAVVHPTGSGKSFISLKWLYDNRDKKCLFLAPTLAIRDQLIRHIKSSGLELSDFKNLEFAIYPNFASITDEFLEQHHYDCVVLDEFHRCGATEWSKGINKLLNHNPNIKVLGVSATPIRYLDDNRNMAEELFHGNIASEISLAEAMAKGILPVPTYIQGIYSFQEDLDKFQARIDRLTDEDAKSRFQDLLNQAKKRLENADGLEEIFKKHITDPSGKYIVFCKDTAHMRLMMEETKKWFKDINPNIDMYSVSSYQSNETNQQIIDTFEKANNGNIKFLFSVEILNEGLHVSDISGVIMLRPTSSPIIYMQQLGRALSVGHNSEPIVFDIVNNVKCYDAINEIYDEVKKSIKKPHDIPNDNKTLGSNDEDIDQSVLDRFKIFDEAKEFADILQEINNQYDKYVAQVRENRLKEQEFKDWLKTLTNEELYNFHCHNEELEKEKKKIYEDFKNGIIKIPIMSNISSKLSGVSNLNFERISPIQFNEVSQLILDGAYLYDDEVKQALWKVFKKNIPNITEEIFEEKYRSLFTYSKLTQVIEIEKYKARLLVGKTNKDIYNIVVNTEEIQEQLKKLNEDLENGIIKIPSPRGLANTLRGTFFANLFPTEDFVAITTELINGANLYDEKIKNLFRQVSIKNLKEKYDENKFEERYNALFRSQNIIGQVALEKAKADIINNKSNQEIYEIIIKNKDLLEIKEKISSEFMQGIFNRAVVGNISNAFRLVSTIDKQYINAVNFNEISQLILDGANLYDDNVKVLLQKIFMDSFPRLTKEMFEEKYQTIMFSKSLINAIETEKHKISIISTMTPEEVYKHFASIETITSAKEKIKLDLEKGIFPTRRLADIVNNLANGSVIQKEIIKDSSFNEIRDMLLSGTPFYSDIIKDKLREVYRSNYPNITEDKFEEKYRNYLVNYKLIESIELERYKIELTGNLGYQKLYETVSSNIDIEEEKKKIDDMLSRGEIPVLMARPINQAFRSGIFADITEQILDGANLYDDNIREQMMKILQENDFASADKTPEEKYIQLLKKEKLVKVIEIEKYKKSKLDVITDKQLYEIVKSNVDISEEKATLETELANGIIPKVVKYNICHSLSVVIKSKKIKTKDSEFSNIADRLLNGANLYDDDIKQEYIHILQSVLSMTEKEAFDRYRTKLSNPVVIKSIELEKAKVSMNIANKNSVGRK